MYIYKISNLQARRIYTTYLLQSVDMLMGIAGDGGDGAHVHRLDGAGQALEAPARRLPVRARARRAVEAAHAAAARRRQRARLPRRVRDARRQRRTHLPAGDGRRRRRHQRRRRHHNGQGHHRLHLLLVLHHQSRHYRCIIINYRSAVVLSKANAAVV